ncbi:MAG: hypothetical protein KAT00_09655, partial [Planctomycetes bacterium]|nr:hypothetical protein [Planctomycetota bacterium]
MRGKLLIALAFLFCLAGPAFAADRPDPPTFRLVPQDYTTIQAAIDAAIDGDVVMVSPGVYFGVGNRDLDLGGKAITVRSAGDPASCIIDCEGLGRGFIFRSGEGRDSMIEGLTIMGGYHNSYGGGIECEFASPTIYNCIIMDCSAYDGGGIDCYGASPLIRDCIISGNSAENNGGGIECYSNSYPEITNCLIESNVAGHFGGAIDSYSSQPVITNCTFVGNAYSVIHSTTDFTIVNCILWNDNSTTELSGCSAVYSCVRGGAFGEGNISTDPQFRTGPLGDYYLRQSDAGQLSNSDCLDAGDPLWSMTDLGLDGYTTRTDSVADSTIVDMGYHYPDGGPIVVYDLDASVAGTLPNGQIQVSPSSGPYNEFSEVRFTANPDVGYKMLKWTGTDDDTSTSTSNVVTMTSDKTVTVEFTPRLVYTLTTLVSDGEGSISPASGPYYEGDWVELTAVPD